MPASEVTKGYHPFADLIGLSIDTYGGGKSECSLEASDKHYNPHNVLHGGVLFSLADSGMGSALYPSLKQGEICATIEIKITYFQPVRAGTVTCTTTMVNRGKTIAHLDSEIFCGGKLVAKASGNYSIFTPRERF